MAHYGLDVLDPAVTPRRIHVLLARLPAGAWPEADSPASWSLEAHLLAATIDAVREVSWVTAAANSKRPPPRPKPMPRPGDRVKGGLTKSELIRSLDGLMGKGRADG